MGRASVVAGVVGLCWATAAGAHVFEKDDSGNVLRWEKPVEIVVDDQLAADTGEPNAQEAVETAVSAYQPLTGALELRVTHGPLPAVGSNPESRDGKSSVRVLKNWPWAADIVARTHLEEDPFSHEIVEADIFLNGDHAFRALSSNPSGTELGYYDIQAIVTHELGHAVGMAHNTDLTTSVMYPTTTLGEITKRTLIQDDKDGVVALYDLQLQRFGCSQVGGTPELTVLLALGCVLFVLGRRRKVRA